MSSETIIRCDQCRAEMPKKTRQKITLKKEKFTPMDSARTQHPQDWGTETIVSQDICNDCFAHVFEVVKAVLTEDNAWKRDMFADDNEYQLILKA